MVEMLSTRDPESFSISSIAKGRCTPVHGQTTSMDVEESSNEGEAISWQEVTEKL